MKEDRDDSESDISLSTNHKAMQQDHAQERFVT